MEGEVPGKIEKVLIIGCGYHARGNLIPALLHTNLFSKFLIYDLYKKSFDELRSNLTSDSLEKISFYENWAILAKELNSEILAVVSTPADSHLFYFEKLVGRGVKYYYIEKPLAQSLGDVNKIKKLSETGNIKIASGFYNSFISPVVNYNKYQNRYNLGNLCSVKAYGGNNDLSAFGIHIIDLANVLFDSDPINIIANINGTTINPRGEKYFYHGGSIILEYANMQELTISYHSDSLISNRVQLIFKYGLIEFEYIDKTNMRIYSIQNKEEDIPIYKHQRAQLVDEIPLSFDWKLYFSQIFVNIINGNHYPDLNRNVTATNSLIGSLISNEMGKMLQLPIGNDNLFYEKQYPIT